VGHDHDVVAPLVGIFEALENLVDASVGMARCRQPPDQQERDYACQNCPHGNRSMTEDAGNDLGGGDDTGVKGA